MAFFFFLFSIVALAGAAGVVMLRNPFYCVLSLVMHLIALARDGLRVTKPGKFTKMVETVEHVTFSGRRARAQGQDVIYVTERCVMRSTNTGLVATEIMPGIDPARDITAASQGRVTIAPNARLMPLSLLSSEPRGLHL